MLTGAELLFVSKLLQWKLEKNESRSVYIGFTFYDEVSATLHSAGIDTCVSAFSNKALFDDKHFLTIDAAIEKMNELEEQAKCGTFVEQS